MNGCCITRFAPSPSGRLHLGHALAAKVALEKASECGGKCYLRIEDIDTGRCRPEFVEGIMEDMEWLGFAFEPEILVQSQRFDLYMEYLCRLRELGVVYPCFCSRKQIAEEITAMGGAPQGEVLEIYPGTCRGLPESERKRKLEEGQAHCWRLDCGRAGEITGDLTWRDELHGEFICRPRQIGDVILARKDCPCSYHIAVTVDDALQGVTLVTRGEDLLSSTHVHRLLQELLEFPVPLWHHHRLIKDEAGKRLAKRDMATSLDELRREGWTAEDVFRKMDQ